VVHVIPSNATLNFIALRLNITVFCTAFRGVDLAQLPASRRCSTYDV